MNVLSYLTIYLNGVLRLGGGGGGIRIKPRSSKSSEQGDGPYQGFGYLSLFSDPLDLAKWSQREILQFCNFQQDSRSKDLHCPNRAKYIKDSTENEFLIIQNTLAHLKGYYLHYGRCTGRLFTAATRHNNSCSNRK